MSEIKIKRRSKSFEITIGTATQDAATLRLDDMAGGVVSIGTAEAGLTSLELYAAVSEDGEYRRVYDASGSAADITVVPSTAAGQVYSLPDAVYALPFIRIVSGNTAATALPAVVTLKS
jgi:hypothetical protein